MFSLAKRLFLASGLTAMMAVSAAAPSSREPITLDVSRSTLQRGAVTLHPIAVDRRVLRQSSDATLWLPGAGLRPIRARRVRLSRGPGANWTWIGKTQTANGEESVVLTFGVDAIFGVIPQESGLPLRIATRRGKTWLIEGTAAPQPLTKQSDALIGRQSTQAEPSAAPVAVAAGGAAAAPPVVDVLVVFTPSMVTFYGTQSAVLTRIAYLESVTNQAYIDSQANIRIRVVATKLLVDPIPDNFQLISGLIGNPSTNAYKLHIDGWRRQYAADLVSVIRAIEQIYDNGSFGWIEGYHGGIFDPGLGYSVIGDEGPDVAASEYHFAHELGHGMGCNHDILATEGDYGAYVYSRGYRQTIDSTTGFSTIMSYADPVQVRLGLFSNPRISSCRGLPCGLADSADNARSITTAAAMVATLFRRPKGDYNGDVISDVFWRNANTGADVIWRSGNAASKQSVTTMAGAGWMLAGKGDFDGDGKADVLWHDTSSGASVIWRSANSTTPQAVTGVSDVTWVPVAIGDFNGDERADIFWRNRVTGANVIWKSANAATQQAVSSVTDIRWGVAGVGDFDGNGRDDIIWRHTATGANAIWKSTYSNVFQGSVAAPIADQDVRVAGIGDFDGDSKADIFWRNKTTGTNLVWPSADSTLQQTPPRVANVSWQIRAIGDFNGDGKADVFWRNASTGENIIWNSASSATQRALVTVTDQAWNPMPL